MFTTITELQQNLGNVKSNFKAVWPAILKLYKSNPNISDVPYCIKRVEDVMVNNVPHGKQFRAFLHIVMYGCLNPQRTEDEDFQTHICAWLIEIGQASALIADDIMDNSATRRGMPCWYTQPGVGLISAVQDLRLVFTVTGNVFLKYFHDFDYVLQILESLVNDSLKTIIGEGMDLRLTNMTATDAAINFSLFTEEMYKSLVEYKTSCYTFYNPIAMAMIRSGIKDQTFYDKVLEVCNGIGELFQIQDDYLDCYGEPDITGKIGTDIVDGKLTWFIAKALKLASDSERKILKENYGRGIGSIGEEIQVKNVYLDLGLAQLFCTNENQQRLKILEKIYLLPEEIPKITFIMALSMIYRREK